MGEEMACDIEAILESFHWTVAQKGLHSLQCVRALDDIYKYTGRDNLARSIRVATLTWGMKESLQGDILSGLAIFLVQLGHLIDDVSLITKLTARSQSEYLTMARQGAPILGVGPKVAVAHVLCSEYNKGKRSGRVPEIQRTNAKQVWRPQQTT